MARIYNVTDETLISGTAYNDLITNSGSNVSIDSGKGKDTINNGYGNAGYYDGRLSAYESLKGGSNVSIVGGTGNDHIYNFGDTVTIDAGDGNDTVYNGDDVDTTNAIKGSSNVSIVGGTGNDYFHNTGDSVTINGGDDNDDITNTGSNVLIGTGSGRNTVRNGTYYDDNGGSNVTIKGGAGKDSLVSWFGDSITIDGGDGNDYLKNYNGESKNVSMFGGKGNDTIKNRSSQVTINGGSGNDSIDNDGSNVSINGGSGNDSIDNDGSNVSINGGSGDNSIYNDSSNVSINGGSGNDTIETYRYSNALIKYNPSDGNDLITGFNSDSTLQIGDGTATYSNKIVGNDVIVTVGKGKITLAGAAEYGWSNERINGKKTVTYLSENDDEYNPIDGDTIAALAGNDKIYNRGASSVSVHGGAGDDFIESENVWDYQTNTEKLSENITLRGGDGNDTIDIGSGSLITVDGGTGKDYIHNGANNVSINGGADHDTIENGGNNVTIAGGKGNDYVNTWGNVAAYVYSDGDDTINNLNVFSKIVIGKLKVTSLSKGDNGTATIYLNNGGSIFLTNYWLDLNTNSIPTVSSMSKVPSLNVINNETSNSTIKGTNGKDVIYSSGAWNNDHHQGIGKVTINARGGDDYIEIAGSELSIVGGEGNDIVQADNISRSTIRGGNGKDSINVYNSDSGSNVSIDGGAGNDTIYSPTNNSTLRGGEGNDTIDSYGFGVLFQYTDGDGKDKIYGFNETSTLSIFDSSYSTKRSGDNIILTVGKGKIFLMGAAYLSNVNITKGLTLDNASAAKVTLASDVKDANASTRTKNIKITGNALDNSIVGGSKNDTITGGNGEDYISGGAGNDKLYGGKGNDTLWGSKGNDSLWGNAGNDTFIYNYGEGKDVIFGFDNNDTLTLDRLDFTLSYKNQSVTLTFDNGSITFKDYTATTFHINDDTYKISGSKFRKQ
ncbi:MAG: hypothetical protein SR1Q5_05175 [Quinella sp. 1Q5]|nr:hypothetical protein [Quinella sp. 1Q5]